MIVYKRNEVNRFYDDPVDNGKPSFTSITGTGWSQPCSAIQAHLIPVKEKHEIE